jgi:hypothetical protein
LFGLLLHCWHILEWLIRWSRWKSVHIRIPMLLHTLLFGKSHNSNIFIGS